jgi:hypothetical protein
LRDRLGPRDFQGRLERFRGLRLERGRPTHPWRERGPRVRGPRRPPA